MSGWWARAAARGSTSTITNHEHETGRRSRFDDVGAGDEVVQAAAIVAENEAPVGQVKGRAEEEGADDREEAENDTAEGDECFAQEPGVEEAGFGAVETGDANFGDDFADRLAADAEQEDLNDEEDEPAGEHHETAEAKPGHVELLRIGLDALHGGTNHFGEFGPEDEQAGETAEDFEGPVDEAREEAGPAFGELGGEDDGCGSRRSVSGRGGEFGEERGSAGGGVELGEVAERAPVVGASEFRAGIEIGATACDPGANLFDAGRAVFVSVAADDGEHEREGSERTAGRQLTERGKKGAVGVVVRLRRIA